MSCGLPVLVSDIPANKEVELPAERYFRCGDVDDLQNKMEVLLEKGLSEEERKEIRRQIEEKYNPKLSSKSRTSRGKVGTG
jgi:glycosyltransferase involved in cell wall biosynthesis